MQIRCHHPIIFFGFRIPDGPQPQYVKVQISDLESFDQKFNSGEGIEETIFKAITIRCNITFEHSISISICTRELTVLKNNTRSLSMNFNIAGSIESIAYF